MYHYTRPSINVKLPPGDGLIAGNFRHVLRPDDARLVTGTAKETTQVAPK